MSGILCGCSVTLLSAAAFKSSECELHPPASQRAAAAKYSHDAKVAVHRLLRIHALIFNIARQLEQVRTGLKVRLVAEMEKRISHGAKSVVLSRRTRQRFLPTAIARAAVRVPTTPTTAAPACARA